MNYLSYIFKFIYRIKWWLILCPLLVGAVLFFKLGQVPRTFKSTTTIYTGLVSGYNLESTEGSKQDWNIINNAMDNLVNIIQSQTTLKNVSMRLYAQDMSYGDPDKDNNYIQARNYRAEWDHTPQYVRDLIDRSSDSITLHNLWANEVADNTNHIYGLFAWTHKYYSYLSLSRIQVKRIANSDMLEVSYENDDPAIVYNTLMLLNDEFVKQYKDLRFSETNNVIRFFESELKRVGDQLHDMEDSLSEYNIANRIINYDEQTKQVASLSRDYELRVDEIRLNYEGAARLRKTIESQLDGLQELFRNNSSFLQSLNEIGSLQSRISASEAFLNERGNGKKIDSLVSNKLTAQSDLNTMRKQLDLQTRELKQITTQIANQQYTKEGLSSKSMISQWLDALLLEEKSQAEMTVMADRKISLDQDYSLLSPVGSTLKRKTRAIGFSEQSYQAILSALNTARLRQKNLQMTSATLKIINPPIYPISPEPSKRKMIVYAATALTFLFVLAFFILLEIIDRTLRDKIRTERITGGRVLGAFPGSGRLRERRYAKIYREIASKYIGNAVLNYFKPGQTNILNFISTEPSDGKSTLMENLTEYFRQTGMKVRTISWNKDFDIEKKEYMLATRLSDFVHDKAGDLPLAEADLVLVEYPAMSLSSIPKELLHNATLNLLVAAADRTWKDTDQLLFDKSVELSAETPILICLNRAQRDVVQTFTGLMPPHSWLRKMSYQIGQFGFTASK